MAILNGTEVKLYTVSNSGVGAGNLVAFAQNCSISIEHSPRDITNKESGGYSESLNGADQLIEDNVLNLRQKFFVGFGGTTTVASDVRYWGECYITSWSVTAGTEDTSTMSISLTGTGVLTQNVV